MHSPALQQLPTADRIIGLVCVSQLRRCLKQLVQLYASDSSHKEAFTVELVLQLWSQVSL